MTIHMKAPSGSYAPLMCGRSALDERSTISWEKVTCKDCENIGRGEDKNHPNLGLPTSTSYKDAGGISIKDVIEAKLTPEQLDGYYLGCAIDYLLRCNFKHDGEDFIKDVSKADDYINWLIEAHYENQS